MVVLFGRMVEEIANVIGCFSMSSTAKSLQSSVERLHILNFLRIDNDIRFTGRS